MRWSWRTPTIREDQGNGSYTLYTYVPTGSLAAITHQAPDGSMLTGEATWEFVALDPLTMDLPIDPLVGFLPPNITSPQGQGSVSYFIHPKSAPVDGTTIEAQASIVFDNNDPIDTNVYVNRIDAQAFWDDLLSEDLTNPEWLHHEERQVAE